MLICTEVTSRSVSYTHLIDDLTNLVLMDMKLDGIAPIHVGDVADVEMTDNADETYAIVNGNPGIMLSMRCV